MSLVVVLDDWVTGCAPGVMAASWSAYCASVRATAPPGKRLRWVMDRSCYDGLLAEHGYQGTREPDPDDMLFGIPVTVTRSGGLPHLEAW